MNKFFYKFARVDLVSWLALVGAMLVIGPTIFADTLLYVWKVVLAILGVVLFVTATLLFILVLKAKNFVEMPSLTGSTVKEAREKLNSVGLRFADGFVADDGEKICLQSPEAMSIVKKNSVVSVETERTYVSSVIGEIPESSDFSALRDPQFDANGNPLSGKAEKKYKDGSTYSGEYKNGLPNGEGTCCIAKGDKYTGTFLKGLPHGKGTYTWPNGDKYDGDWKAGNMHGKGTYTWPNGHKYEGDFVEGKLQGKGTYTWPNGDKYDGDWKEGKFHGKGTYTYAKDDKEGRATFTGYYVNDLRNGHGTLTYKNGSFCTGTWKNGDMHGKFLFYDKDGQFTEEKTYKNNEPVS